jgi:hypothetical protein
MGEGGGGGGSGAWGLGDYGIMGLRDMKDGGKGGVGVGGVGIRGLGDYGIMGLWDYGIMGLQDIITEHFKSIRIAFMHTFALRMPLPCPSLTPLHALSFLPTPSHTPLCLHPSASIPPACAPLRAPRSACTPCLNTLMPVLAHPCVDPWSTPAWHTTDSTPPDVSAHLLLAHFFACTPLFLHTSLLAHSSACTPLCLHTFLLANLTVCKFL